MAKNGKLPKRIAGVKVPKTLRKRGHGMSVLLNNPIVADLIAAALLFAAERLAKNPKLRKVVWTAGQEVGEAAKAAEHKVEDAAHAAEAGAITLGHVLAAAARQGANWISSNAGRRA